MSKFCDNCGAPLGDAKRFCGDCGAPIAGRAEPERETPPERLCDACGAVLPGDARFCEACGRGATPGGKAAARLESAARIAARYSPVWLILILFLAVALFALPESLLETGLPPLLEKPLPWVAAFIGFCLLAWLAFFLERRDELKKLGIDPNDLKFTGAGAAGGGAAGESGGAEGDTPYIMQAIKTYTRLDGMRYALLFSLLAVLAAFGLSMFGFSADGGGGGNLPSVSAPPGGTTPGPSAAVAPWKTETPAVKTPSLVTPKLAQSLDGIWLPYEESVSSGGGGSVNGVPVPNMSTLMPSILFENGCMYMGYGSTRDEIRQYSREEHYNIADYAGYPFTLENGVITISDPYTSTPDRSWEIDDALNIYIGGSEGFVPSADARVTG